MQPRYREVFFSIFGGCSSAPADTLRRPLATSQYLEQHSKESLLSGQAGTTEPSRSCAHYFLDPLSWMRDELEQGKLEGRLECPKCNTNIGKYAWQGMQCSCGTWIVPGISLAKSRIDEVKIRKGSATMGIRQPPGMGGTPPQAATRENL